MSLTDCLFYNRRSSYSQLQTMCEKADYVCTFPTSQEEIVPMLVPAKEMIKKIGNILFQVRA